MILRLGLLFAFLFALPALAEVPLELDGAFVQGGIVVGHTSPDATVRFGETDLPLSAEGAFVFGFGRNHEATATLVVMLPDGQSLTRQMDVERREYVVQRVDGVPQETVTPPEEVLVRIRAEAAQKREARAPVSTRTDFASSFVWPLTGPVSGTYGNQRIYNGEPRSPHMGVDVVAPTGTPVIAPAGGVVVLATPDMYFEGGLIFLDHGHGMIDVFMHLSEVLVEPGQQVAQGEVIGLVGAGGRATGPHLDWRMYVLGTRVDPSNLVGAMPEIESEEAGVGDQ